MEDGQVAGSYAPDREDDDPVDLEYNGEAPSDSNDDDADDDESSGESSDFEDLAGDADVEVADPKVANTRTAAQGGMPDPSLEEFLADWSDDNSVSKVSNSDAAPRTKPPKVPTRRASATSSSSGAASSKTTKAMPTASKGKQPQATATRVPIGQAPLNVAPLRCRMPTGAPRTIGYALVLLP